MASEITIGGTLALKRAGQNPAKLTGSGQKDQAGDHYIQRVDTIGTIEETISKGDIATLGYCAFKNVGTSGEISIGGAAGSYAAVLSPGEFFGPVNWATNAIFAISDEAGAKLELFLIEA